MDQSEAFRKGRAAIKDLEAQLEECGRIGIDAEQTETKKEIEEHFAQCMNALAARKEELLLEVDQKAFIQKTVQETQKKLEASIKVCKQAMEVATSMYSISPTAAENFCKELQNVTVPKINDTPVVAKLPKSLFDTIKVHGNSKYKCFSTKDVKA
eukprot:Phypoly_transcript_15903.p1 GENE.Phypoly_transcript_15903~~Phypoly_transcript_15903.p1  ORF type:complete len:155 (+),score=31.61 Phypoly_transcript_15903:257-721(+)